MNSPYISGTDPPPDLPLGRFLPPIPGGLVTKWCKENLSPGEWVLDPFGFSPTIPIEAAAAGNPILVTVNNPIHAFLLKVLASAPKKEELIAALQDLAVAPKSDERMEPYIRSLYHVSCTDCHHQLEADAFLWKKGADHPYAVQVDCPNCGARGEQQLTEESLQSLSPLPPKRLHLARALNRIVDRNDPIHSQVENTLNAYPARPLIVLQTIINKLDSLEQTPRRRELLIALILSAADRGNTLWAHPSPRNRPRQIVIPSVYRERNLWKVLEESVEVWQTGKTPLPVIEWDGQPSTSIGIYRFRGRFKSLDFSTGSPRISAILTAIPRPNQAFWTLSALWTGWIWGQDAVNPIRPVLSRQRYDWNWHENALKGIFDSIHALNLPNIKFSGLIAENEPMLLLAALLAANAAGFKLTAFAQSHDDKLAQCSWDPFPVPIKPTRPDQAIRIAKEKVAAYLVEKGEPASYQQVHAAAVSGLANENNLAIDIFLQTPHQATSEIQKWIESLFQTGEFLTHIADEKASLETGDWWLNNPSITQLPLMDRVEERIILHLIENQTTTAEAVKEDIYQAFPGIFTPEDILLLTCLESYADLVDPQTHLWKLRDSEKIKARQQDVRQMRDSLINIAHRLDFQVNGHDPLLWFEDHQSQPCYSFHIFASAAVSRHLQKPPNATVTNILVLPGSRANLLAFKKERNPLLKQTLDQDFLVVKFRLIRDLEINPLLSRDLFTEQIIADPPEYHASQLVLF